MPFNPEVAIVFGSMLLALFASLLYAYWYQSMKHNTRQRKGGVSDSIKLSELESLMRRAVADAMLPLEKRLETLESDVQSVRLRGREDADLMLMEHDGEPRLRIQEAGSEEDAAAPVRPRVR